EYLVREAYGFRNLGIHDHQLSSPSSSTTLIKSGINGFKRTTPFIPKSSYKSLVQSENSLKCHEIWTNPTLDNRQH
ncbi:5694_t:CDS:1, partial [Acaulospora colombiana]